MMPPSSFSSPSASGSSMLTVAVSQSPSFTGEDTMLTRVTTGQSWQPASCPIASRCGCMTGTAKAMPKARMIRQFKALQVFNNASVGLCISTEAQGGGCGRAKGMVAWVALSCQEPVSCLVTFLTPGLYSFRQYPASEGSRTILRIVRMCGNEKGY